MRGQFALLSLKGDCSLYVHSINLHVTYLITQLGSLYKIVLGHLLMYGMLVSVRMSLLVEWKLVKKKTLFFGS